MKSDRTRSALLLTRKEIERILRESPEEITIFKSVGTAVTDVSTALRAYKLAQKRRVGKSVNLWGV